MQLHNCCITLMLLWGNYVTLHYYNIITLVYVIVMLFNYGTLHLRD